MYKYFWIIFILFISFEGYTAPCPSSFRAGSDSAEISNTEHLIDTEKNLMAKGFSKEYTDQFDESLQLVELKKHWKKIKADPEKSHLPYFADKIDAHIYEIKKGIQASQLSKSEKQARLKVLEILQKEAHLAKTNNQVTYNWWNIFNIRLIALVISPIESAFELGLSLNHIKDHQEVYRRVKEGGNYHIEIYTEMMNSFPNIMLVPAIGEIGLMAFNQTMAESVHFIGVSGVNRSVDGKKLTPQQYFRHDVEHANSIEEYLKTEDLLFYSQFKRKIKDLPQEIREQQEFAYFLLLHERGGIIKGNDYDIFERNFHGFAFNHPDIRLLPRTLSAVYVRDRKKYKELLREYFDQMNRYYTALSQDIRNSN